MAAERLDALAVAAPIGTDKNGETRYDEINFRDMEAEVQLLAQGLVAMGVTPGTRLALLVKPSVEFVALVFALLRSGAVTILIDPGMGKKNLLACLDAAKPAGFVAISPVHAVRTLLRKRYAAAKLNVTVGRRWFWGGETLASLRKLGQESQATLPETLADDPAAIIFTTGSTGPPKGVLYTHRIFDTQVTEIRDRYAIQPGEVDLPGFPLFGLFNAAMGVTTIIPEMDPTRPAQVDPVKIITAVRRWNVTQSFGSPAIWNRVGRYCEEHKEQLLTLRRVLSAGAPVPAHVLKRMRDWIHPQGEIFTPYGATEALPVASISASEVLNETAEETGYGSGVCVGTKFDTIEWRVIKIVDGPIETIDQTESLPTPKIGELIVTGPQVTQQYVTRTEWNPLSKIKDGDRLWHRMGDAGFLDEEGRFWFCGRVAHRVRTREDELFTVCCEGIVNTHRDVFRSALVGIGEPGKQTPVMIVELEQESSVSGESATNREKRVKIDLFSLMMLYADTEKIPYLLFHPSLPVDIRHNAKIFREKLAVWAADKVELPKLSEGSDNLQAMKAGLLPYELRSARESILDSPLGELTLGWRQTLWRSLDGMYPKDSRLRRAFLAYLVVKEFRPLWMQLELEKTDQEVFEKLLLLTKGVLKGDIDSQSARYQLHNLECHAQMIEFVEKNSHGFFLLRAALSACRCALEDEQFQPDGNVSHTDKQIDPDCLDSHFLASCVAAGGATWESESNPELRREFWLHWLDDHFSRIVRSKNDLKYLKEEL